MTRLPPPVALPLAPPRLTRNEAEGRSLIAQHVQQCSLSLGDTVWNLSLEPLAHDAATAFGSADWLVRAEWAGAPFELRLPATSADQWLRARFTSLELPQLPEALRTAAFESALQDVLEALESTEQGPVRINSVEPAGAPAAPDASTHQFGVALDSAGMRLWATLATDALGLMLMAGLAAHQPVARGPVARRQIPMLLRAVIGTTVLSQAGLRSLRPGDAVLLAHSWIEDDAQLWLGDGNWGLRVRADGPTLVVTQPLHMTEIHMKDELEDPSGDGLRDEEAQALDVLPVRLHFDLGQRTMTLAEVGELQVGQVLELGRPLSQAVNIRANGALVGTGELMEIGGRIAVGITSLGRPVGAGA